MRNKIIFIIVLMVSFKGVSQVKNTFDKYERLVEQIDWTDTTKNKTVEEYIDYLYSGIDFDFLKTNFFYGRAIPYSGIENFDGKNIDTAIRKAGLSNCIQNY